MAAPPFEPPPPQAAINAVAMPNDSNRDELGSMMHSSLIEYSQALAGL
jgi:hypothetical protein